MHSIYHNLIIFINTYSLSIFGTISDFAIN